MSDTELLGTVRRLLVTVLEDLDLVQAEVERGVVYLEGIARTAAQKQRIEQLVRRVPGVRDVVNCLALEHLAHLRPALDVILFLPTLLESDHPTPRPERFGTS